MEKAPRKPGAEGSLDEALAETFPASDPVALGHSDHVGTSDQPAAPTKRPAPKRARWRGRPN